ncbi:DUF2953 domain-containing protein [Virgibacillus salexigens]|uniref:DUF2953 domain-containing protein n=1 Tax=Virgibacillus TaxID=84406 RepID=UPI00136FAE0E|nr:MULTISPECIES: DUF2953 domain-containing protein [Virgibacillus]MYL41504.1 DUF2953 domain-containing protein [Virgibacillus massiliensis]
MWGWFIFIFCLVLFVSFVLLSKLFIRIQASYIEKHGSITIYVYWFSIRLFKKDILLEDKEEDNKSHFKDLPTNLHELIGLIQESNRLLTIVFRSLVLHQLRWHTKGGAGDASLTGMASGGVWTMKGILSGWILEKSKGSCKPDLQVIPLFQQIYFKTEFSCMVSIRIAQAINACTQVMREIAVKRHTVKQEQ